MNKFNIAIVAIIFLIVGAVSLGNFHVVSPGMVAIVVPQMGGDKGIDNAKIMTDGWTFTTPAEKFISAKTSVQIKRYTADERDDSPTNQRLYFNDKKGMRIGMDVSLRYRVEPQKIAMIYKRYKKTLEQITESDLYNSMGDAFNEVGCKYKPEEIMSTKKIELLGAVTKKLQIEYEQYGLVIEKIGLIGSPELPPKVVAAINSRIQRENQTAEETAKADMLAEKVKGEAFAKERMATASRIAAKAKTDSVTYDITQKANAQAEANRKLSESLSSAFIEYKRLEKWDGKLSQVTSAVMPGFNIGK